MSDIYLAIHSISMQLYLTSYIPIGPYLFISSPTDYMSKTWSQLIEHRKRKVHTTKMIHYEDKIYSKKIAKKAGIPIPKNLWIGRSPNKIPFSKLPKHYVVKPTHHASARGVFLMNNGKNMFTGKRTYQSEIIKVQQHFLAKRISKGLHEWANQQIPKRILIEEYLPNLNGKYGIPTDYKCYCFHGRVCMVRVDYDRLTDHQSVDYYNRDFLLIDFDPVRIKYPVKGLQTPPPIHYDKMIKYAEKLSSKFGSFIRVDMYLTPDGPYFGEFTIYPGSGKFSMFTQETDRYMGLLWENPKYVLGKGEIPFTKEHFEKVLNTWKNKIDVQVVKKNVSNINNKDKSKKVKNKRNGRKLSMIERLRKKKLP